MNDPKQPTRYCTNYHLPGCSADGWWQICEELPDGEPGKVLCEFPNMGGTDAEHDEFVFTLCMVVNGISMACRVPSYD